MLQQEATEMEEQAVVAPVDITTYPLQIRRDARLNEWNAGITRTKFYHWVHPSRGPIPHQIIYRTTTDLTDKCPYTNQHITKSVKSKE